MKRSFKATVIESVYLKIKKEYKNCSTIKKI